jgi:Uma2 family endonuclease
VSNINLFTGLRVKWFLTPNSTTPDLILVPKFIPDFDHNPAKYAEPPLLTIEIQSPSQSTGLMVDKTEIYFAFGVKSCWIVIPSLRAVIVCDRPGHYQFFHGEEIIHDIQLDIQLPVAEVFA